MFSTRLPGNLGPNRLAVAISGMQRAGRAYVDLTESNPTRAGFAYPADLLAPLSGPRALSYEPAPFGAPETRAAVAASYERSGVAVAPDRIALTASTSEAYSLLFKLLTNAGDEVLVPRPSYPLFDHLTTLDLVTPRPYALEYQGRWAIDLDSVERAMTSRTRAILVVSPNNPTGSFIGREELERLEAICARRGIAIIADEVFADYELEPGAAAEAGRPAMLRDVLSFSLGGLSKSVGLPQVKVGWIAIAGPQPLVGDALDRLELICDTYLSVSTPAQIAAPVLLERGRAVHEAIAARVRANYRQLRQAVLSTPSCSVLCAAGGWYGVMQVPTFETEEELVLRLLTRQQVLAHPGYFFDFPRESFLIVSLLTPEDAFRDGISRILRGIDRP